MRLGHGMRSQYLDARYVGVHRLGEDTARVGLIRESYTRSKVLIHEVAKSGIVGILAVPITIGGADALRSEAHLSVLASVTVSIVVATIFTFLGNKYWTFKHRTGSHLRRESVLFFLFNGVGLLIQLAFVSSARYGLEG
jgi:putative flippase GtrA